LKLLNFVFQLFPFLVPTMMMMVMMMMMMMMKIIITI